MAQELRGGGLRFARLHDRVYFNDGSDGTPRRVKTHAEYGLLDGDRLLARIIRNGKKWIALQVSEDNQFGRPVSPINYVLLRDVKEWALKRWSHY